jgi:hypothetical protein
MYIYIHICLFVYLHIYIYLFINIHTYTENMFYQDFTRCNHQFGICICAKKMGKIMPTTICFTNFGLLIVGTCGGY